MFDYTFCDLQHIILMQLKLFDFMTNMLITVTCILLITTVYLCYNIKVILLQVLLLLLQTKVVRVIANKLTYLTSFLTI